ncbi:unnamed protein product [Trifolium pratense]|uniref:Uncharacterized protein n=1 Tax=Trifolium pratense TaxID=57577 RepID=A0ACB0LCH8_TRIPR|nr:unnamed protein product [Trifolium pratense]
MDRISNLPDEILCHILSFLPTNLAFTTTILSTRWTPLFHSLDFLELVFKDDATSFNRFCRFVDTLMLSTNKPLKTFHLDCSYGCKKDCNIFNAWLEALIQRRVQQLHLNLDRVEVSSKDIPVLQFQNLIHLKVVSRRETRSIYCWWYGTLDMLRLCPKLQFFFIEKWRNTGSPEEWKSPISVVECVSSHLRSCTILNFDGSANDLSFATYILKNASLLQDMKIGCTTEGMLLEKPVEYIRLPYCIERPRNLTAEIVELKKQNGNDSSQGFKLRSASAIAAAILLMLMR